LDDLEKETGGRIKKQELTHSGELEVKEYVSFSPDDWDEDTSE
jgi:hypothetical protein